MLTFLVTPNVFARVSDMESMSNRRVENRLLCAELVELRYRSTVGQERRTIGNLEDISLSGACLQMEDQVPEGAAVTIAYGDGELVGLVRYCVFRDANYFLGIEFSEGCRWSENHFRPEHLLDPHQLVCDTLSRHQSNRLQ